MAEQKTVAPMREYMEVEFRTGRLGYYQNVQKLPIDPEDLIIVEVERGEDIAQVTHLSVSGEEISAQIPQTGRVYRIKRLASDIDIEKLRNLPLEEEKAAQTFADILLRYPFEMKLIETVYQFDGNKLTFFFTADGRIDFRVFVRELANVFRTRIELHQTTGRDEARRLGGYGMCGLQYCCGNFLKRFNQVTIKMAKDQNLAGNLAKISGPCGRLLCCLNFEEDFYLEESKDYPIPGTCVELKGKRLYVFKTDVLNKRIHLSDEDQSLTEVDLESFNKLKVISVPDIEPC
ncbi:MAG TPA: regulatory iron-sulfur-containing complex subunit RicT [Candidatus Syntrophosphaera sp.]|nr:regulatory iron-sulfur-containing complex subunit RicT [Candidatus Syntrophosphaera sp.]HOR03565.1 regulatory iron-sulfur-containing complex subunit RicT [Candidatus Syntrophosphaera sp.]HOU71909.1 regulatory iron-sulfur-containing complex subunit RicT [Candidatus Syntrophosphaera sp.]HPB43484.1 regulatory iron-sulfur-containing complex subunit RicT [Candidatus Syntrophosphaera sp.]HQG94903.1 regulatory iron-sulfur-containing complex subunit RicT [Candidatus Syntrophosphaera sp.]